MASKPALLFLAHRIPFPPDKGDKIRSFNLIKKLSERFDIYLGCFIDDANDEGRERALMPYCKQVVALRQSKFASKILGLTAFMTGKSITEPYYYRQAMQNWVDHIVSSQSIRYAFVYSSSMAQYLLPERYNNVHRVIDFVDVDSDKWRQYATAQSGVLTWFWRWLYQREYRTLAKLEQSVCERFDFSLFVSNDEAELFKTQVPGKLHHKVAGVFNGVDTDYFDPNTATIAALEKPMSNQSMVFTGAMDYPANVDAVVWFVKYVWPYIIGSNPEAHFYIVGGNPTPKVRALAQKTITVTGRVPDVRPYIAHSRCVVAPLQIARGIQNKVLEAMAMDRPVVCTYMAMEGINAPESLTIKLTDNATDFAKYCQQFLAQGNQPKLNRQWLVNRFTWQQTLANLAEKFYHLGAEDTKHKACQSVNSGLVTGQVKEVENVYR